MTRLAGGRDGIDAITPEDFIGHDIGPGERTGLLALAANEEVAAARDPGRDAVLRARARARRRAQGAAPPGPADLDLREPEGPVRDPRHPAEQGHRVGPALAAAHRLLVLRLLLAVAAGHGARRQGRGSCRPSGFLAGCYARRDLEGVHYAPANLEIEGAVDVSLRVTEDHIGLLNSEAVNTFRLQRGVRPWGARTASSDPQWRLHPGSPSFHHVTSVAGGRIRLDHVRAQQPADLGSREGPNVAFLSDLSQPRDAGRRESRAGVLRKMRC